MPDREGFPAFEAKAQMHHSCTLMPLKEKREVASLIERECPAAVLVDKEGAATVDLDALSMDAFAKAEAIVQERTSARLKRQLGM